MNIKPSGLQAWWNVAHGCHYTALYRIVQTKVYPLVTSHISRENHHL